MSETDAIRALTGEPAAQPLPGTIEVIDEPAPKAPYLSTADAVRLLDEFAQASLLAAAAAPALHEYAEHSFPEALGKWAYDAALECLKARQALLASGRLREVPGFGVGP